MTNKYSGRCVMCGDTVGVHEGIAQRRGHKWVVYHADCFDRNDHSSYEDRECGDAAYEQRCFEATNY